MDSLDLESALEDCPHEKEPEEEKGEKSKHSEDSYNDLIICEEGVLDDTLPPDASSTPERKTSPPEHLSPGRDIRKELDERRLAQLQEIRGEEGKEGTGEERKEGTSEESQNTGNLEAGPSPSSSRGEAQEPSLTHPLTHSSSPSTCLCSASCPRRDTALQ